MPKTLQLRRDIDANVSVLTGAAGEPIVDTTNFKLSIHDGVTPGGHKVVQENGAFVGISGKEAYRNLGTANTITFVQPENSNFYTPFPWDLSTPGSFGGPVGPEGQDFANRSIEFASFFNNYYPGNTTILMLDMGYSPNGFNGELTQELLNIKAGDTITIKFRSLNNACTGIDLFSTNVTLVKDVQEATTFLTNNYTAGNADMRYYGNINTWYVGNFYWYGNSGNLPTNRFLAIEVNNPLYNSVLGVNSSQPVNTNWINSRVQYNNQQYVNLQYVLQIQSGWWSSGYDVGLSEIDYIIPGGTIASFTPSLYNELLRYNGSIVSNYGANNYGTLITYPLQPNSLILNSANIVSQVSNTTVFQTYAGTNFAPTLQVGQNLSIIENPFTGNTMMNGQLVKVLGYQDFGPISNTFTQTALVAYTSLNPSWPGSQYYISNESQYYNLNNWIFAPYNGYVGGNYWYIMNTTTDLENLLSPYFPQADNRTFELNYSANGNNYAVTFIAVQGDDGPMSPGTFEFGDNVAGNYGSSYFTGQSFIIRPISITKNGLDISSSWTVDDDWNTSPVGTLDSIYLNLPGIALGINVATTAGMTNTTTLLVDNYKFTPSIIDSTNNSVVLSVSASSYANINLIGSAVTTNTYNSPYATIQDISENLPAWVKSAYTSGHSDYIPGRFQTLKYYDDPNNTYQIYSPGLTDITNNGFGTNTPLYTSSYNRVNQAQATPQGWSTQNPWTSASFCSYFGDIATQYGVFANTVYGVTSVVTPTLQATNVNTTNVTSSLVTTTQIKVLPDPSSYDPYFANVQYLLSGSLPTGSVTNQGNGGSISYSAGVSVVNPSNYGVALPSGAPATANVVVFNTGDYINFNNNMTQDIGSSQYWTVETWFYTPWAYADIAFLNDANAFEKFEVVQGWPYYPEIFINGSYALDLYTGFTTPMNVWTHYAYVRNGNHYYAFINGQLIGNGDSYNNTATPSTVGDTFTFAPNCFGGNCFAYNYRVTVGNARYTSNFTPSLQPFSTSGVVPTLNNAIELQGGFKLDNLSSVPSDTPTSGGYLFVQNGVLKYKGSNGTVTTIANA